MVDLVAYILSDAELISRVEWFNDKSVYSQMSLHVPITLEDTVDWFRRLDNNHSRRDFAFYSSDGELIAMGGLVSIDPLNHHSELYIVVRPGLTGKGIGSRSVEWMCNYGFSELHLNKIYLYTLGQNEAARRLYKRLGFTHEGIMRSHVSHMNEYVDRHVQSLLRSEWESIPWRREAVLSQCHG